VKPLDLLLRPIDLLLKHSRLQLDLLQHLRLGLGLCLGRLQHLLLDVQLDLWLGLRLGLQLPRCLLPLRGLDPLLLPWKLLAVVPSGLRHGCRPTRCPTSSG
jgi:hypothetical protein